jgi:hypothetical protein
MDRVDGSEMEAITAKLEGVYEAGQAFLLVYNGMAFDSNFAS